MVETLLMWSDDGSQAPREEELQPKDSAPRSEHVRSSLDRCFVPAAINLHHVALALKRLVPEVRLHNGPDRREGRWACSDDSPESPASFDSLPCHAVLDCNLTQALGVEPSG